MASVQLLQVVYSVLIGFHTLEIAWCQSTADCPSGYKCVMPINCKPDEKKLIVGQPSKCDYDFRLNEWRNICCPDPTHPAESSGGYRSVGESPEPGIGSTESPPPNKGCIAPDFLNGYAIYERKRKIQDAYNSWISNFRDVDPNSLFDHGQKLYIICLNGSTFEGMKDRNHNGGIIPSVICTNGRWNPEPTCFFREYCPPEHPFEEYKNLSVMEYRDKLLEHVCYDIDFAWKGHVKNVKREQNYFYNITFEIETVFKQGIEKREDLEGKTRNLFTKIHCESAFTNHDPQGPKITYLIMGKDAQEYKDGNGVIRYRYFLDKHNIFQEWTSLKNAKDKKLQGSLNFVFRSIYAVGCDNDDQ